jgi:RNA polymerase sigma factor (sigma-70 family)
MRDDLVQRCLGGDQEAFSLLVDEYKAYVFAIILKFVQDKESVRDIAQEVFLQVYRSLPQYRQQNFKGWVRKIAANKTIDFKRKKQELVGEADGADTDSPMNAQDEYDPDKLLLQNERESQVREVVNQLPDVYRQVLYKFYFQEMSYEEIAREEGISLKTVESRLYRARNIFRRRWGEAGE